MPTVSHRTGVQAPGSGELLDLARLQDFARSLALELRVTTKRASWRRRSTHFRRLDRQTRLLADVYRSVADDVHRGEPVSPSAEWLLDNFHLITNEVRSVRRDLPPRYYRRLPQAATLDLAGATRIEILAAEIIGHSDGRVDAERLRGFVVAFQSVSPLTIGEHWAWSSVLKLALVGRVAGLADRIRRIREDYARADASLTTLDEPGPPSVRGISGDTSLAFVARSGLTSGPSGPIGSSTIRTPAKRARARAPE